MKKSKYEAVIFDFFGTLVPIYSMNTYKEMEENNIILNYSINFNPKKIRFNGKFIVRIKPRDPSKYNEIALKLEKMSEITHYIEPLSKII